MIVFDTGALDTAVELIAHHGARAIERALDLRRCANTVGTNCEAQYWSAVCWLVEDASLRR